MCVSVQTATAALRVSVVYASSYVFLLGFLEFFAYLECHCSLFRKVRSKTCPWSFATLLSIVTSALER